MLLNCPVTLWWKEPLGGGKANTLQISLSGKNRSQSSFASMLRKKIVHYAREFKSTNPHESFLHLLRSNCFDQPTLKLCCEEWPEFAYFDLKCGARPLHTPCSDAFVFGEVGYSIRYLITRAPDVLALQDSFGRTPLHLFLGNTDLGPGSSSAD